MEKKNVYQIITDKIIAKMEQGELIWQKPFKGGFQAPRNLISNKAYRGINVFLLWSEGYASPYWVSFKQAKRLGGSVKKGEHGTVIVFWKPIEKERENKETGEIEKVTFRMLRYYRVFNVLQCEGLDDKLPKDENVVPLDPLAECQKIVDEMPLRPEIDYTSRMAAYVPSKDKVLMPPEANFEDSESLYSTLFHELTHSTGHASRIDRPTVTELNHFGSHEYSKEELIAEFGAAYLCGVSGIENKTINNSAAYIQGWKKELKNDPKLVVWAASQAQKAVDFILAK